MWPWIKEHLETLNLGVSIFGGLASVLIAWFAYQIDMELQQRSEQEARISRSVALTQAIFADDAFKDLLPTANDIELAMNRYYDEELKKLAKDGAEIEDDEKVAVAHQGWVKANLDALNRDGNRYRSDLILLLQHVDRAAKCIGQQDGANDRREAGADEWRQLCDTDTLFVLAGEVLADLYFQVRAALTCDDHLKEAENDVASYKEIVKIQIRREQEAAAGDEEYEDINIDFDPSSCDSYVTESA